MRRGEKTMKYKPSKELKDRGICYFLVLAAAALFIMFLLNFNTVWSGFRKLLSLFIPFYVGFVIAYLINPFINLLENKVFKKVKNAGKKRTYSLLVAYLAVLLLLGGMLSYLLPQLLSNITSLVNGIPDYYNAFSAKAIRFIEAHPSVNEFYQQYSLQIGELIKQAVASLSGYLGSLLPALANTTIKIGSGLMNFFIGLIISIYFLAGKEKLIAKCKMIISFFFKTEERIQRVLLVGSITHEKTLHFITAQLLDSLIVAIVTYLFMTIFGFPYALLNALIIGIFNTIPYFGPWIGAVPPGLIILIVKPSYLLWYILYTVILQLLDGNILNPRIQGKQMNLSALWIMFAIFLFGGIFGFLGMVIGVPFFAVIYYFISAALNNGLHRQGKSTNTADYASPEDRPIINDQSK